jgi:hypothetical protein
MSSLADAVYDEIEQTLLHHRLCYWQCEDDEGNFPLIDMLTPEGHTIQVGHDEIQHICDAIYNEVLVKYLGIEGDQLLKFYGVTTPAELIKAMEAHIAKLQAKVPTIPDQFPGSPRHG